MEKVEKGWLWGVRQPMGEKSALGSNKGEKGGLGEFSYTYKKENDKTSNSLREKAILGPFERN